MDVSSCVSKKVRVFQYISMLTLASCQSGEYMVTLRKYTVTLSEYTATFSAHVIVLGSTNKLDCVCWMSSKLVPWTSLLPSPDHFKECVVCVIVLKRFGLINEVNDESGGRGGVGANYRKVVW